MCLSCFYNTIQSFLLNKQNCLFNSKFILGNVQVMDDEFSHTVLHRKPVNVQHPAGVKPGKPVIKRKPLYQNSYCCYRMLHYLQDCQCFSLKKLNTLNVLISPQGNLINFKGCKRGVYQRGRAYWKLSYSLRSHTVSKRLAVRASGNVLLQLKQVCSLLSNFKICFCN